MRAAAPLWAIAALLAACGPAAETGEAAAQAGNWVAARPPPARFPELTGPIVDRADLLTAADEAELTRELQALERRTTDQLVIVTVTDLAGEPIADYARNLGNHWGVGQADKDNGVLLVVAPHQRETRIEVGYGLGPILTDARAREIMDREMLPHFREGGFAPGIRGGARAIIATLIAQQATPRRGRP